MSAITKFLVPDNTTNENFRAWGSAIDSSLTSFGITRTADTGQIDWASANNPSGGDAYVGYEIRQFTDELQNFAPVYFKIRYGSYNCATVPKIQLTIGASSDGAGHLTTVLSPPLSGQGFYNSYYDGCPSVNLTPQICVFSGDKARFFIGMFMSWYAACQVFSVERTKNNLGFDTAEGLLVTFYGKTGFSQPRVKNNIFIPISFTANIVAPILTDTGYFTPIAVNSSSEGNNVSMYPNYFFRGGTQLNPGMNTLCYYNNDVPPGYFDLVNIYGSLRRYFFAGNAPNLTNISRGSFDNTCLAVLYE